MGEGESEGEGESFGSRARGGTHGCDFACSVHAVVRGLLLVLVFFIL